MKCMTKLLQCLSQQYQKPKKKTRRNPKKLKLKLTKLLQLKKLVRLRNPQQVKAYSQAVSLSKKYNSHCPWPLLIKIFECIKTHCNVFDGNTHFIFHSFQLVMHAYRTIRLELNYFSLELGSSIGRILNMLAFRPQA